MLLQIPSPSAPHKRHPPGRPAALPLLRTPASTLAFILPCFMCCLCSFWAGVALTSIVSIRTTFVLCMWSGPGSRSLCVPAAACPFHLPTPASAQLCTCTASTRIASASAIWVTSVHRKRTPTSQPQQPAHPSLPTSAGSAGLPAQSRLSTTTCASQPAHPRQAILAPSPQPALPNPCPPRHALIPKRLLPAIRHWWPLPLHLISLASSAPLFLPCRPDNQCPPLCASVTLL